MSNNQYLMRLWEKLNHYYGDMTKMHEYFNIKNTKNHIRKISLERDGDSLCQCVLTIESRKRDYDLLKNNIIELPRDMNNEIYDYLYSHHKIKYTITLPPEYPFVESVWNLIEYQENGKKRPTEELMLFCNGNWSPAMSIDKEILTFISTLEWF
jgi:hypothetical protein